VTDVPDLVGLAESLRALLPAEALLFEPGEAYAVDGLTPLVAALPRTPEEVAAVLRACTEAGAAVIPRGAGTQISLGMPPERYDVALDLSSLERLFEHEAADLTVTVDAAHGWDAMQSKLGEHGQWVPLDPVLKDGGHPQTPAEATRHAGGPTVGGILATNASGPARIRYGTARDLVIGMTVALASGEIVKSGGRVVKNVAGYDMAKLHIGALGTLGVILQASFKVSPLAESRPIVVAQGNAASVSNLAEGVLAARLPLLGLELIGGSRSVWSLAARFGGGAVAVERAVSEFGTLAAAVKAKLTDEAPSAPDAAAVQVRAGVLPAKTVQLAEALADAGAFVSAYPGVGALHCSWTEAPEAEVIETLRRRAVEAGGALVLERAPVELKRAVGVWGEPRGDFALMQRLKQQFDPARTLNPGRFVGGI
jgi:glycolate oxidase FAD binding subunit